MATTRTAHNFVDGDIVDHAGYDGVFTISGAWRGYLRLVSSNGTYHYAPAHELELAERPAPVDTGTVLLVTTSYPSLADHVVDSTLRVHPNLGRLVQPRHYPRIAETAARGITWAADNDCFQGLDERAYVKMLDALEGLNGCRFVTVPDVVGDSVATLELFDRWAPELERRRLPMALVAQDGLEDRRRRQLVQWDRLEALFIGGSTEWKESAAAASLACEAKMRGKWVHWGRVNTRRRFDLIVNTNAASSFDGSKFARFRKTYLDAGLAWAAETTPKAAGS